MNPRLTGFQLDQLEKQLVSAEKEFLTACERGSFREKGPATLYIEFKATEYIRRLLEDVKSYRAALAQTEINRREIVK